LLDAHEAVWLEPFANAIRGERIWARGLVEGLHTDAAALTRYGANLFDVSPVRRLIFTGQNGVVEALASIPEVNALAALDVMLCDVDLPALRRLAELPGLGSLKEVNLLFNRLDDSCVDLLCDNPFFRRLSRLHLGCNPFTAADRERLRERCGDHVCFERRRHPERLFTLTSSLQVPSMEVGGSGYRVGHGRDRTQLYLEEKQECLLLLTFDQLGDLLRMQTRPTERQERPGEACGAWRKELGLEPGAIRVKRFAGVYDFPKGWADSFDQTDNEPAELEAQAAFMRRWLEEPAYRVGSYCGGEWFHLETGERVSWW